MKPEDQRIAIAEACRDVISTLDDSNNRVANGKGIWWHYFDGAHWHMCKNNDPLNDLNACHEMEKVLTPEQCHSYTLALAALCKTRISGDWRDYYNLSRATVAQRAEAFLRTVGKWRDE